MLFLAQVAVKQTFGLAVRFLELVGQAQLAARGLFLGLLGLGRRRKPSSTQQRSSRPSPASIVALIVAQSSLSPPEVDKIRRCVQWCYGLGHVRHVLVYDPKGILKAELGDLAAESNERFGGALCVHVIAAADAMQPLVDAALGDPLPTVADADDRQGECSGSGRTDIFSCAVDPAVLDEQLRRTGPAWATLRPEVAFVFGPVLTLAGFPPWNCTRMEIFHLGALGKVSQRSVEGAMQRYCKTQQRFGR